jgi:hypothetical protein
MPARESIPASVKLTALYAVLIVAIAIFAIAPWRQSGGEVCTTLQSNIEAVRRDARARTSDTFVFSDNLVNHMPRVMIERGDFASNLTLEELRGCLGAHWAEVHSRAQATETGDAWLFFRSGSPDVLYVQAHNAGYERAQWKIMIRPSR